MDLWADILDAISKFGFFISLRQYMCGLYLCIHMRYGNIRQQCIGGQINGVFVLTV